MNEKERKDFYKQLHHIIRLYDCLEKDVNFYKYTDEEKIHMLDIKRGRFPKTKEEAFLLRDEYVRKLNNLYESRKLSYTKQEIDYDLIDEIVIQSYMNR